MKQKSFGLLTIAFVSLLTFSAFKHHTFSYQVKTCMNTTDGSSGELLEQQTATFQKAKNKTSPPTYTINGAKSPLRCKLNQTCLEVYADAGMPDPFQNLSLYKLTSSKTGRTLTMINDGSNNSTWIPMQIPQVEPGKYKVYLGGTVTAGEYAFVDKTTTATNGNVTVWAFGIDQ